MVLALHRAEELKLDCVQVFTKNQRQWKVKPLVDEDRDLWLEKLGEMGWDSPYEGRESRSPVRTVSHNSYLINMASPDAEAWEKSVALQRVELERCAALHIPCLVAHPGAHLGAPRKPGEPNILGVKPSKDEKAGLKRIAKALNRLHRELPGCPVITCLETTVGSGTNLGYDFQHLAFIRELVKQPERVGFCFDTCHVHAAGYDMTTDEQAAGVMGEWDAVCGASNLHVFHFNDSMHGVGTRKDRHAHINDGHCGRSCFRTILNHPAYLCVPKILETPKEADKKGKPWDITNIRRLKRLIHPPSPRR